MKYKYSIILPIYNVEEYLEECIESVLNQTYKNYEIILVDDGSLDNSGNICDKYSNKFDFIKTIHKRNGGLSDARNIGVENANGDYTIFLDSDDFWVDNQFLENITLKLNNDDLLIFNSVKYFQNKKKSKPRFSMTKDFENMNFKQKIDYVIKNNIYKACAWDKVIKTSILKEKNIIFPIGILSEDMLWGALLLDNIKTISIYDKIVYAYRQRKHSISKNVSEKHISDIIKQLKTKFDNDFIYNYFAYEYIILLAYTHCANKNQKKHIKQLDFLLNYDLSDKVKKIRLIYNYFGFFITTKILQLYITLRRN